MPPSDCAKCPFCGQESHSYARVKPCVGWEQHVRAIIREAEIALGAEIDRLDATYRRGYADLMRERIILG